MGLACRCWETGLVVGRHPGWRAAGTAAAASAHQGVCTDDIKTLADHNARFIEACRQGPWEMLKPLLSGSFWYLDGATGEAWDIERYIKDLTENPAPGLAVDQVTIRVDGGTAVVSAR
jgi:hypothetical protein